MQGNSRYGHWVRKIPTPATDKIDMLNNMIQEIPHFLFFMNRREMYSRQKSRMWFSPVETQTEALRKLIEHSLPTVVKEIREKVRQFFYDFDDEELHITPKQIASHMLGGRYGSYYIIRECKAHLNVDNLFDHQGEKTIKTCIYKWKDYAEGVDTFEMRTNKHVGQPLVFKREDFLTDYETKILFPPKPEQIPEPEQKEIDFSKDKETPF
jgi:outer membrane receptor for monomeric catechols